MTAIELLVDDFAGTTIDGTKWPTVDAGVTQNDKLIVSTINGTVSITSTSGWDLTDSKSFTNVIGVPNQSFGTDAIWALNDPNGSTFEIERTGADNSLKFRAWDNVAQSSIGTTVAISYSATQHAWWRIRWNNGDIVWETSTDAASWTERRRLAAPAAIDHTNLSVQYYTRSDGSNGTFEARYLSIVPATGSGWTNWVQTTTDSEPGVLRRTVTDNVSITGPDEQTTEITLQGSWTEWVETTTDADPSPGVEENFFVTLTESITVDSEVAESLDSPIRAFTDPVGYTDEVSYLHIDDTGEPVVTEPEPEPEEPVEVVPRFGPGIEWMELRLQGEEPLELMPAEGINAYDLVSIDFGFPTVREVSRTSPLSDGEQDSTVFHGAKVVSMTVHIYEHEGVNANDWAIRLKRFLHPSLRPILAYKRVGDIEAKRIVLRCENGSHELSVARPTHIEFPILWKVPTGRAESLELKEARISALVEATAGRTYPLIYPRVYPFSGPIGGAIINNAGDAKSEPIIRIYGPCTAPKVYNDTVSEIEGQTIGYVFDAATTVNAGDFIQIDPADRTVTLNGDRNLSVLHNLDYEQSNWWSLARGQNQIRFIADTFSSPSQVQIRWRNTYL